MTAIVGVLCSDGVVVGADSSATFGAGTIRTIEQPTEKLFIAEDSVICAGTGAVGLGQRFEAVVAQAWNEKLFQMSHVDVGKELCNRGIADFASTGTNARQYGALVAFPNKGVFRLCEFPVGDFQPEHKTSSLWYCSMGSGQLITDPFLGLMREVYWGDSPPTLSDGIFAATWALHHAIQVNPGGINAPIRIAVLERGKGSQMVARMLEDEELDEHRQNIDGLKGEMRKYRDAFRHAPEDAPEVPEPD